jgi:hypothetical protein
MASMPGAYKENAHPIGGGGMASMPGAYKENAQAPDQPWYINDGSIDPEQRGYIGDIMKSQIYGRPGAMRTPRGPGPGANIRDDGGLAGPANRMGLGGPSGQQPGLNAQNAAQQSLALWSEPANWPKLLQTYTPEFVQQQVTQMEQQLANSALYDPSNPFGGGLKPESRAYLEQMLTSMKGALNGGFPR